MGGGVVLTPELVLVSPELLAEAQQRQTKKRKAAMSSSEPANGTFFVDPAQPAPPPVTPEVAPPAAPTPEPVAAPAAAAPAAAQSGSLPSAPMIDVPLGTLIFRAGLLAEEQLEDALQEGMRTGKRLGEVLIERGWLHERDLGRLLAGQKGLPFVEISPSDAEPAALQQLPEEKAKLQVALPLRHEDGQLVVAVADPSNELMLENLRRALGAEPKLVVAPYADLVRSIGEAYGSAPVEAPAPPEPVVAVPPPAVPVVAEPMLAPPEAPQPEVAQPESQLAPPAAPEPVAAEPIQPLTPPAVTPLPTVLPPAEERAPEPVPSPLAPPPPAEPAPPPAAVQETPAVEAPVTPAIETVPPLHQQAAPEPQPEPVAPPAPVAPVEPEAPVAQPPLAQEPVLQPPVSPPAAAEAPPAVPAISAPPVESPAPQAPVQEDQGAVNVVVLRLRDGDALEIGSFPTAAEAAVRAQELVAEIAAAEANGTWPFFAQRYLRPNSILSVDLVEENADQWLGSAVRRSWAGQQ